MKYVIMKYLRVSSEDIDLDVADKHESDSITNQRALLDDFISKTPEFEGAQILEEVDDGATGTNFMRPGIRKLLDLAERGKINCIIVKDLSRFGRNHLEVGDYLEQKFPAWGVRFISLGDMYDSAEYRGLTGGINIAFRNLIAEMYSRDISEKVKTAVYALNKSGKTSASYGFYGYIRDKDNRNKLIEDEPAAEIVRLIFDLREQGMATTEIACKLNKEGKQTPNERKQEQGAKRNWLRHSKVSMWERGTITRILRDERYTGKHIYGKTKCISPGSSSFTSVPRSDWIIVPNAFPAIITDEQFERVRNMSNSKAKSDTSNKTDKPLGENHLFYRKIACGICGKALERASAKDGYIYYCSTPRVKEELGCMHSSISEDIIIKTVLTALRQKVQISDNITLQKLENAKSSSMVISDLHRDVQNLERLIEQSNNTKLTLWERQQTGGLSCEAFKRESEKLTKQVTAYANKIAELKTQIYALEMKFGAEDTFTARFSKQVGTQELSREVVDEFIKAVYVYTTENIEVVLNYADEYEPLKTQVGG